MVTVNDQKEKKKKKKKTPKIHEFVISIMVTVIMVTSERAL